MRELLTLKATSTLDDNGQQPIQIAIRARNYAAARLLAEASPDSMLLKNTSGVTAYDMAVEAATAEAAAQKASTGTVAPTSPTAAPPAAALVAALEA
ncbi:hypothetical protein EON66_08875, partial [archaeon]